eukprot:TRINITY_DN1509_c0_g1_i1.p1 TRINITY_DN1509_c0_g1~~TRINITY_DN1509_c0_g1_i1.p1  ORF type:complete len:846 (-),score=149.54 TRINITY_DN1509_c0_g1_i1:28-2565(-)
MDVSDTRDYYEKAKLAADFIVHHVGTAEIAVVLGSGLNNFTDELSNTKALSYSEIPHVPRPTVKGHSGKLVAGEIGNKRVICLAGRSHAYEGRHSYELTFFARVLKLVGCKLVISTNASGGAMEGMYPGCLMIIRDHINFYHRNPLADTCEFAPLGEHYVDMSSLYSERIADVARSTANKVGIKLFEGVYGGTSGPTYETPAEVRAFTTLGASAFGMSTMPEAMAVKALKMESFAISLITNLASGLTKEVLTHADVTAVASASGPAFVRFMKQFLMDVQVLSGDDRLAPLDDSTVVNPLPQPQYPVMTKNLMSSAVQALHSFLQKGEVNIAVLLSQGHDSFLDDLTGKEEIKYKDIPHFPQITSSRNGKLVFGSTPQSKRVVCLAANSLEGFACEESTFLMELLYHVGVKLLVQTFIAGTSSPEDKLGQIVALNDCLETTTIHPFPRRIRRIEQYNVETDLFDRRHVALFRSLDATTVEGSYCHIPGPSFPTGAEVNTARLLSCNSVGITSTACLYSARALGMDVAGISENLYFVPGKPVTSTSLLNLLARFVDRVEVPTFLATQLKEESPIEQISWHLPAPVIQGIYEDVLAAATFVKDQTRSSASIALILDEETTLASLAAFEVRKEFLASEIPFLKGSPGKLIFGELDGIPMYIAKGMSRPLNEGVAFCDSCLFIRMLAVLDVKKMLFVSSVCSTDKVLRTEDIAVIRDHVLLSGRNTLFGPNEDRWGTRFPDVGEAYNKEFQKIIFDNAKSLEINPLSVCLGHFVGPLYKSEIVAKFAQLCGIEALSTGIATEVLVARHMGVIVGAIAHVTSSIASGTSGGNVPSTLDLLVEKSLKACYRM